MAIRTIESQRRLAINSALAIWRDTGSSPKLKRRIRALGPMLNIITDGVEDADRHAFIRLALDRFRSATDPETAAVYISSAFALDGAAATEAFLGRLDSLNPTDQTLFGQAVLPQVNAKSPKERVEKGDGPKVARPFRSEAQPRESRVEGINSIG